MDACHASQPTNQAPNHHQPPPPTPPNKNHQDKYSPPPVMDVSVDSPERDVEFLPTKTPYDPRHMLAGTVGPDGACLTTCSVCMHVAMYPPPSQTPRQT